jgi:hypothetical protein
VGQSKQLVAGVIMPIDAGIYQQNPLRSVADYEGDYQKQAMNKLLLQQNALALQTGQMGLQDRQRAVEEAGVVRNALAQLGPNAGDPDRINALKRTGTQTGFAAADALEKAMVSRDKEAAGTAKTKVETQGLTDKQKREAVQFNLQSLSTVNNPQQYASWLDGGVKSGLMTQQEADAQKAQIPQTPAEFGQLKQQQMMAGVELAKQFDIKAAAARDAETAANNVRVDSRVKSEGAANRGVQIRGQDKADARARESTAAAMSKPFEVTGPDGPMLVQQDKQGNIRPVEGYQPKTAAEKPLNDAQSKAALFGGRMEMANDTMVDLEKSGVTTSLPGARTGYGVGAVIGAVQGPNLQKLDQAKRNFINATLRRESGAVIADSEFANADQQYFPQVGDSKEVIAEKRANREAAIRGVQIEIPEKIRRKVVDEVKGTLLPKPSADHPADISDLLKKYVK